MSEEDHSEQIQIRCSECGQRFKVGPELHGRMVECGACEHRFRVTDETTIRSKKFYPGEKKSPAQTHYSRQPHLEFQAIQKIQSVEYAPAPPRAAIEPTSFGRTLIGVAGAILMVLVLLVLITSGKSGSALHGVTTDKRLIIALFTAVIASVMIIYANPRSTFKASLFALLGSLALAMAPLYFKEGSKPLLSHKPEQPVEVIAKPSAEVSLENLKEEIGYTPVEKALAEASDKESVTAIWLRDIRESNSLSVFSYLKMITQASESSQVYPRMNDSHLVVLVECNKTLEQVAKECARLGEVTRLIPELHLLEVTVKNSIFDERPIKKLSNAEDPAFYQLNLMELEGIDEKRINEALKRLIIAPPTQARADIVRRLNELVFTEEDDTFENISQATLNWSDGKDGAPQAMMKAVMARHESGNKLNNYAIRFLVKTKQVDVLPILTTLWQKDPQNWEELFIMFGTQAEGSLIPLINKGALLNRLSASRIAARIGTQTSLDALQSALQASSDPELKTSYQNAIRSISNRN